MLVERDNFGLLDQTTPRTDVQGLNERVTSLQAAALSPEQ